MLALRHDQAAEPAVEDSVLDEPLEDEAELEELSEVEELEVVDDVESELLRGEVEEAEEPLRLSFL